MRREKATMSEYNREQCEERKKRVNERLDEHGDRIEKLEDKFDGMSRLVYETTAQVKSLSDSVSSLTDTLKWGFGIFITVILGLGTLIVMMIK